VTNTSVLILAGQREGVVDPLCAEAGVERKAVIPINGRPMIDYVLSALDGAGLSKPYWVSGFDADYDARLTQSSSAPGPAGSALMAFKEGIPTPAMMTTCDHPLLTTEMLNYFVNQSAQSDMDFTIGLAEKSVIQPVYPNTKRTYLKFKDNSVSGCNLFYIANAKGWEAIRFWEHAQHHRKNPLKLASKFGMGIFFRYLLGQLTLEGAFKYASKRMNIKAKPILLPFAEAAIDVDKPSDKVLVEGILKRRPT